MSKERHETRFEIICRTPKLVVVVTRVDINPVLRLLLRPVLMQLWNPLSQSKAMLVQPCPVRVTRRQADA